MSSHICLNYVQNICVQIFAPIWKKLKANFTRKQQNALETYFKYAIVQADAHARLGRWIEVSAEEVNFSCKASYSFGIPMTTKKVPESRPRQYPFKSFPLHMTLTLVIVY